jgi:predicted PurR-regulated permease PerM
MTFSRPVAFWVSIGVISFFALLLLRPILMPFASGLILAYLLVPVVNRLERFGIDRSLAALMIVISLVIVLGTAIVVLLPALIEEVRFLVGDFPRTLARVQSLFADARSPWLNKVMSDELRIENTASKEVAAMSGVWLDDIIHSAWSGGEALFSLMSLLVVVPIVTIYFLIDWTRMVAFIDSCLPSSQRTELRALAREVHDTVTGFVRGQIVICLILAGLYAIALRLTGLNHAILIGITAGLVSFVPYLGAATGLSIAMCVAIAQFWPDWAQLALIIAIFLAGETFGDYVLSPRIIGKRVNLNPLWLLFALFAFAYLLGAIGLLVAIPLAATLGVLLRFVMRKLLPPLSHR